jgi:2-dehydropantoate 2-reductase
VKRTYAIIGSGAVGALYGAWLARAGFEVHFLARSDHEHIRDHGLVIDSVKGNFALPHVNVYVRPQDMPKCDVAAITLKTTANAILPDVLPHVVKDNGVVLVMQNGMGFEERVAAIAGQRTVLGVLCFVCSNKVAPGHVRHLDFGHITIGQYTAGSAVTAGITAAMKDIADDFTKAGVSVNLSPDLTAARWKKLVWNVPYNGLSVALGAMTDSLMKNPHSRGLVERLMREVCAGAAACGHPIEEGFIEEMLSYTDSMTPYATSMKIDFDAKRPMEVESIFGAPLEAVKKAGKAGKDLPLLSMLYDELKFLDEKNLTPAPSPPGEGRLV